MPVLPNANRAVVPEWFHHHRGLARPTRDIAPVETPERPTPLAEVTRRLYLASGTAAYTRSAIKR